MVWKFFSCVSFLIDPCILLIADIRPLYLASSLLAPEFPAFPLSPNLFSFTILNNLSIFFQMSLRSSLVNAASLTFACSFLSSSNIGLSPRPFSTFASITASFSLNSLSTIFDCFLNSVSAVFFIAFIASKSSLVFALSLPAC